MRNAPLERSAPSVIKRLINLLSECAREMADSTAARKQAEGAHRHIEGLMSADGKEVAASGDASRFIDPKEHKAEVEKFKKGRRSIGQSPLDSTVVCSSRRGTQSTRRHEHATRII